MNQIIILVIIGVIILWGILMYNTIIRYVNAVKNAFSSIDTALQNRLDLIPNIVETVKQYVKHEQETLMKVTEMRSNITGGKISPEDRFNMENTLAGNLKTVFALAENYPDLKANQNFIQLQNSWFSMEEEIAASRRSYNATVTDLENAKSTFPSVLVASMMKIQAYPFFEADEAARVALSAKNLFSA